MTAENKSAVISAGNASREYDYTRQCWVVNGKVAACGHREKTAGCYACAHVGESVGETARATRSHKFELKRDGSVDRVGRLGAYGPTVEAVNKTEATFKLLAFAYRAAENTPKVKIRNGAYQLAYESLSYGINVESGVEGRDGVLCLGGEKDWKSITDETASFAYYASEEYARNVGNGRAAL